MKDYVKDFKDR